MKNLINGVVLGTVIGTSTLFAGDTKTTLLGVTPSIYKFEKYVALKIEDDNGNPITNANIDMLPHSRISINSIHLSNIDKGEYVLLLRQNRRCEHKILYNNQIIFDVNTQDSTHNEPTSIQVKFDCRDNVPERAFETEHPYKNNTNVTKVLPALCSLGKACVKSIQYANITGKTEKNYDTITISQRGKLLGTYSGQINAIVPLDSYAPTKITFKSDSSVTDKGVVVKLGM